MEYRCRDRQKHTYLSALSAHICPGLILHDVLNFLHGRKIDVIDNVMLHLVGCRGKIDTRLCVEILMQSVNQSCREGITAADAIHHMNAEEGTDGKC